MDNETAFMIAGDVVQFLVEKDAGLGFGKLDSGWLGLSGDAMNIDRRGEEYLIISVRNEGEEKTLYVLMSAFGRVIDANFTGRFEGVE